MSFKSYMNSYTYNISFLLFEGLLFLIWRRAAPQLFIRMTLAALHEGRAREMSEPGVSDRSTWFGWSWSIFMACVAMFHTDFFKPHLEMRHSQEVLPEAHWCFFRYTSCSFSGAPPNFLLIGPLRLFTCHLYIWRRNLGNVSYFPCIYQFCFYHTCLHHFFSSKMFSKTCLCHTYLSQIYLVKTDLYQIYRFETYLYQTSLWQTFLQQVSLYQECLYQTYVHHTCLHQIYVLNFSLWNFSLQNLSLSHLSSPKYAYLH